MLSLLLATALASAAPAQPFPEPASFNANVLTHFVLDDPEFAKELGLSADQIKALKDHRTRWLDDYYKLSYTDRSTKRAALTESNDKALAKILTEKQLPLLRKRLLWEACFHFGEFRTLRYPDVTKELGINEQQTAKLSAGEAAEDVLTGDQKKKWDEMRGPRPERRLKFASPREAPVPGGEANPERLMLLVLPVVQQHLKLTDKQKAAVEEQAKKWLKEGPAVSFGDPERAKALVAAVEKAADEPLDEGQRKRLAQLQGQKAIPHGIGRFWDAAVSNPRFQKDVGLSDDQKQQARKFDVNFIQALIQVAVTAEAREDLLAAQRKLADARREGLLKLLTPDQKKKADELYGEALNRRLPYVSPNSLLVDEYGNRPPQLVLLRELAGDALGKELNLSKEAREEVTKLSRAAQSIPSKGDTPAERAQSRQKAYEELLGKMEQALGKEGYRRANQILVQLIADPPDQLYEYRPRMLAHWPDMIAALKLTEEQVDRLEEEVALEEVLDRDQMQKFKAAGGDALKELPQPIKQPPAPFLAEPASARALTIAPVAKDLQLTEEQVTKLRAWAEAWEEAVRRSGRWRDTAQKEKVKKQLDEQLAGILKESQQERVRQIEYQLKARSKGLYGLLEEEEFAKTAALTDEEKANLQRLKRQRNQVYQAIGTHLNYVNPGDEYDFFDMFTAMNEAEDRRAEKVFGAATAKRLKDLFGPPVSGLTSAVFKEVSNWRSTGYVAYDFGPPY